jgi:hypothetical protein
MRIFVAGEGPDEIGDWAKDPAYVPAAPSGGVVESLLRKIRRDGWTVVAGCPWRRNRKFKFARGLHGDEVRNVLGAIDQAAEAGCAAIAFVRDRDEEVEREHAIEAAIERANVLNLIAGIVGGVAIETTDAWILALLGMVKSEQVGNPKRRLQEDNGVADGLRKADVAASADLAALPSDAHSLRRWLEEVMSIGV